MVDEIVKVKPGYEDVYELLIQKRNNVENKIREQVKSETALIDEAIALITYVEAVEIPDVVETTVAEVEPEFVEPEQY